MFGSCEKHGAMCFHVSVSQHFETVSVSVSGSVHQVFTFCAHRLLVGKHFNYVHKMLMHWLLQNEATTTYYRRLHRINLPTKCVHIAVN